MDNKGRFLGVKEVEYKSQYDKTLLVPINREERRKEYVHPMFGVDVWTAFEVSYLLPNGLPQFKVLRVENPADSINIFESKSFKLYLNSFNNTVFSSLEEVVNTIQCDLTELTRKEVSVVEVEKFKDEKDMYEYCTCLESLKEIEICKYTYDKSILKTIELNKSETVAITRKFYSDLLRSNCEITNQPDWGRIYIEYVPNLKLIDQTSLLQYIVSYRNHQEFHEPTCERIYQDLYSLLDLKELTVICQYTRRGGIDINPIRSSNISKVNKVKSLPKLIHQ